MRSPRVYQCAHAISTNCSGSRPHKAQVGISDVPSGKWLIAMLTFAGRIAMNSAIVLHAANRRVAGKIRPRPHKISATPEM